MFYIIKIIILEISLKIRLGISLEYHTAFFFLSSRKISIFQEILYIFPVQLVGEKVLLTLSIVVSAVRILAFGHQK